MCPPVCVPLCVCVSPCVCVCERPLLEPSLGAASAIGALAPSRSRRFASLRFALMDGVARLRRPNRSATERRAQASRAAGRAVQQLLRMVTAIDTHRGQQPSRLGASLRQLLDDGSTASRYGDDVELQSLGVVRSEPRWLEPAPVDFGGPRACAVLKIQRAWRRALAARPTARPAARPGVGLSAYDQLQDSDVRVGGAADGAR